MERDTINIDSIEKTISERQKNYGSFKGRAHLAQEIKSAFWRSGRFEKLLPYQREAMEMIAEKISRVINGDPSYIDSWHDIAGYATLVEKQLIKDCKHQ
jgi:Tfp pilus assembly protein PilF